jgi:hypothetical protein
VAADATEVTDNKDSTKAMGRMAILHMTGMGPC